MALVPPCWPRLVLTPGWAQLPPFTLTGGSPLGQALCRTPRGRQGESGLTLLRRRSQPTGPSTFTMTRQRGATWGQAPRAPKASTGGDESLLGRQEILPG